MADNIDKMKKRKRIDGSSKPIKRVAIEGDKQITISVHESGQWAPVIVSTPGVEIPTSINLKPYASTRKNAPSKTGISSAIATKELVLHSSDHSKLDYIAREEEAGGTDALLKHYVGVYDPETGKLEVMEARKMVVRCSVRAHQAAEQDEISTNIREQRNTLGQTFGTKKARKAIISVTENAISPDKSARALAPNGKTPKLDLASSTILANMSEVTKGMASRDQLAQEADDAKPRPKANKDASDVKDVYTIDSLIGLENMKYIPVKQWQDLVKQNKEIFVNSRYVANRIRNAASDVEKLKILRYMLLMIELYNGCRHRRAIMTMPKREEMDKILGDVPKAVLESIKRQFTSGGSLSKYQQDLLITNLCAMACLVDNFELILEDLAADTKMEQRELGKYFHEIGAKVGPLLEGQRTKMGISKSGAASYRLARLKLPLDFPKVSFGRRS